MARIRCLFGHTWDEWALYWENFVGGEVRRKRCCLHCQTAQHEHVHFGRPDWVGEGPDTSPAAEPAQLAND
jgi:hypothetical protein